jgi:hypothetical protein
MVQIIIIGKSNNLTVGKSRKLPDDVPFCCLDAEYNIGKVGYDGQIRTFTFLVSIDWEIERTHDPAFVVEDYNVWANKIAERIRESLQN